MRERFREGERLRGGERRFGWSFAGWLELRRIVLRWRRRGGWRGARRSGRGNDEIRTSKWGYSAGKSGRIRVALSLRQDGVAAGDPRAAPPMGNDPHRDVGADSAHPKIFRIRGFLRG